MNEMWANELLFFNLFLFLLLLHLQMCVFLNQNSISADVEVCRNSQIIHQKFLPKQSEQIVVVAS